MKKILRMLLAAPLLAAATCFGQGVILWDESVNGELSQDFTHPTSLTPLLAGTNSIIGATEIIPYGNTWGLSPDEFVLIIPSNLVLTAVFLTVDKSKVWAWIGDPSYFNQLGWVQDASSGELLSQWGIGSIGPGPYGMYMENHDAQPVPSIANYRLDFVAQPTPEPAAVALWLFGAALIGFRFLGSRRLPRR